MMCQCRFILGFKKNCIILVSDIALKKGYAFVGAGSVLYGKLQLPLNFVGNLKLL